MVLAPGCPIASCCFPASLGGGLHALLLARLEDPEQAAERGWTPCTRAGPRVAVAVAVAVPIASSSGSSHLHVRAVF